jgi:hypothetical protein
MKGLMFRKTGKMLFISQKEASYQIWMLFMRFPIDIIFIDKENRIIDIIEHAVPLSWRPQTWTIYTPQKKCLYVLEAESGVVRKKKWSVGDMTEIYF